MQNKIDSSPSSKAVRSLTTLAVALPGIQAVQAETQIITPKTSLQYMFYDEGKKRYRIDVYEALLELALTDKSDLKISFNKDVQSGASVAFYLPKSRDTRNPSDFGTYEAATTTASIEEYRNALDVTGRYFAEDFTLAVTGNLSEEHDFTARGGSFQLIKDFNQKNTTLKLGYGFLDNCFKAIYQASSFLSPRPLKERFYEHTASLTLEQILTDTNYIQETLEFRYGKGDMNDPYKLVYVYGNPVPLYGSRGLYVPVAIGGGIPGDPDPQNGLGIVEDTRPRQKESYITNTTFVQYIKPWESSVHLSYRFIHNSWGINSHTATVDYYQPFWDDYEATIGFRYYTQSSAKFYHIAFNYGISTSLLDTKPLGPVASSDYRLSKFGAITYKGGLSMKFLKNKNAKVSINGGYIDTRNAYYAGHQSKTPNPSNNFDAYFVGIQLVIQM